MLYGLEDNEVPRYSTNNDSVDAKFFHHAFNHSEQWVLEHLCDALADAEPWWCQTIKNNPIGPCDACLKGRAPLLGPTGQLPQGKGLIFIGFYHCNVPAIFTGNTTRLTSKHACKSKFLKSVSCKRKSDAPQAVEIILCNCGTFRRHFRGDPTRAIHCAMTFIRRTHTHSLHTHADA